MRGAHNGSRCHCHNIGFDIEVDPYILTGTVRRVYPHPYRVIRRVCLHPHRVNPAGVLTCLPVPFGGYAYILTGSVRRVCLRMCYVFVHRIGTEPYGTPPMQSLPSLGYVRGKLKIHDNASWRL